MGALEEMCGESDPLAVHIFVSRRLEKAKADAAPTRLDPTDPDYSPPN